jgi:hypothetical protein
MRRRPPQETPATRWGRRTSSKSLSSKRRICLDLSALLSPIKSLEGRPGHPAADPRILLAVWLFASARQVARLCGEHIAYRWLCGGVGMNAKTLADLRVGHGAALEDLLIDSFAGLVMAGVASLEDCREEAAQAVRRLQEEASRDPCAASRREAAARLLASLSSRSNTTAN